MPWKYRTIFFSSNFSVFKTKASEKRFNFLIWIFDDWKWWRYSVSNRDPKRSLLSVCWRRRSLLLLANFAVKSRNLLSVFSWQANNTNIKKIVLPKITTKDIIFSNVVTVSKNFFLMNFVTLSKSLWRVENDFQRRPE